MSIIALGETDHRGTLVLASWNDLIFLQGSEFVFFDREGNEVVRSDDFDEVLAKYNPATNSKKTSEYLNWFFPWYETIHKNADGIRVFVNRPDSFSAEVERKRKLREWMREHPEEVQRLKEQHGI